MFMVLVTLEDLEGSCNLKGPFLARKVESMCDDCKKIHSIWRGYKESEITARERTLVPYSTKPGK